MFSQRHSVLRTPPSSVPHSASSTQSLLAADSSPLPFLGTLTVPLIIIWNLLSTIPLFIGRNVWIKRTVERAFPGARSDDFDAVERLAVARDTRKHLIDDPITTNKPFINATILFSPPTQPPPTHPSRLCQMMRILWT